ncbi:MAG: T9SS type A sorting domain-containing protein [Bacteroidota bacterium]
MKKLLLAVLAISSIDHIIGQTAQFPHWNTGNSALPFDYFKVAVDSLNNKWVATYGYGAAKLNGTAWTIYNSSNSGLTCNAATCITVDKYNNVWIGTDTLNNSKGLYKFNGTTWTVYHKLNSGLPAAAQRITCIDADTSGNIWIGTDNGGVVKYNGSTWTVYNTSNSNIGSNQVEFITVSPNGNVYTYIPAISVQQFNGATWSYVSNNLNGSVTDMEADTDNNLWLSSYGSNNGIGKYNGVSWTYYTASNSTLPSSNYNTIYPLQNDTVYLGTQSPFGVGLVVFDGVNATTYTISNSSIPNDDIYDITADTSDAPWFCNVGLTSMCFANNPVITPGGPTTFCDGDSVLLTSSPGNAYLWSTGATTQSIYANASGTYMVTVTNSTGCPASDTITVTELQLTVDAGSNTAITCGATVQLNAISSLSATYSWYPAVGLSSTTISNPVGQPGVSTTYYVVASVNSPCAMTAIDSITIIIANSDTPSICMVTVDSLSQYNVIIWDKTLYMNADSFIVYREITTNNYQRIASIPYDSLSRFVDTVATLYFPNTGNPNSGTYRYKLQTYDTCGSYSPLGPYHNTIYMTNVGGTFSWPQLYTIENAPNPVNAYVLMRDNYSNGNWQAINSVAGTQQSITDPAYNFWQPSANWRIETMWNITCTPTLRTMPGSLTTYNASLSNAKNPIPSSVSETEVNSLVVLYPNPAETFITIGADGLKIESIGIYDMLGNKAGQSNELKIDISGLESGVYYLHIRTAKGNAIKKFVKL